ncbi:MAG: S8 family serine peptidase, partial [Planctomycetota bacterium]
MGIWDSLHFLSALTKRRRGGSGPKRKRDRRSKPRDLRMEQFEHRVLLSITPGADDQAIWEYSLAETIEEAGDLSTYSEIELATTDRWVVGLTEGYASEHYASEQIAASLGAESTGEATLLGNSFVWEFSSDLDWQEVADRLGTAEGVTYSYPLVTLVREVRQYAPLDPLFPDQWHLENTGQTSGTPGADANVTPVWDPAGIGIDGTGVVIGIVDDGLEYTHPDLAGQYVAAYSFDFNFNDPDPLPDDPFAPLFFDNHGTAVAGVAAAEANNSEGGAGAAPGAGLAGLRLLSTGITDQEEADALSYESQNIDVYNNSWGPADGFGLIEGPGPLTMSALRVGALYGRGGLGTIYTWAGGNGGAFGDNANYDGYANSRYTIAVAAIDHNGQQSSYSEPGAPILISAYSSGAGVGITTTDRTGDAGYNAAGTGDGDPLADVNYTSTFGGTSSATPLVSGVVALMLEANPALTYRDVQHILVETAERNDPTDGDWTFNAAGHAVNHKYGFGAIDAEAAVTAAQLWQGVATEEVINTGVVNVATPIPGTGSSSTVSLAGNVGQIEWVEVVFDATFANAFDAADLEIRLIAPSGTESILAEPHFADPTLTPSEVSYSNWTFTSARHWGESSGGDWTLVVTDSAGNNRGTWNSWQLNVYGQPGQGVGPELIAVIPTEGGLL